MFEIISYRYTTVQYSVIIDYIHYNIIMYYYRYYSLIVLLKYNIIVATCARVVWRWRKRAKSSPTRITGRNGRNAQCFWVENKIYYSFSCLSLFIIIVHKDIPLCFNTVNDTLYRYIIYIGNQTLIMRRWNEILIKPSQDYYSSAFASESSARAGKL